jgi:branched-chain amino acid transport system substrate-binding protein
MEPNLLFARHLAETCIKLKVTRVAAIYDLQNRTYTVDIFEAFRAAFTSLGGTISAEVSYDSTTKPAFLPLVQKLGLARTDGVMVLANSVDAIVIGQQIRKTAQSLPILSGACGIAQRDLLQQAGKAVDNFIFTVPVNSQSSSPDYIAFRNAFSKRFNYQPTFAAVLSYDAARALFAGLKKNPDPARLKETLQSIQSFTGLQGDIRLDKFGDPNRRLYIYRRINGKEEIIE